MPGLVSSYCALVQYAVPLILLPSPGARLEGIMQMALYVISVSFYLSTANLS